MFKKLVPLTLTLSLLAVPSFVHAEAKEKTENQKKHEKLNEKLGYLREQYKKTKDIDDALEALTKKYASVEVVDSGSDENTSNSRNGDVQALSSLGYDYSDLDLNDRLVYDDEIEEYVFVATWEWDPDYFYGDQPWDFIGVYTEDTDVMPINPDMITVTGYNAEGDEEAFFDSATETEEGRISTGARLSDEGAGFFINDKYVYNGMLTAVVDKVSTYSGDRIYLQYEHSYTDKSITGIAAEIGRDGGGFEINWDTGVEKLEGGSKYSVGEYWD